MSTAYRSKPWAEGLAPADVRAAWQVFERYTIALIYEREEPEGGVRFASRYDCVACGATGHHIPTWATRTEYALCPPCVVAKGALARLERQQAARAALVDRGEVRETVRENAARVGRAS